MSVAFELRRFTTAAGPRAALVVTPSVHVRVDAARLTALREGPALGPIEALILRQAAAAAGRVHVCVFRGVDDHGWGSWGFAGGLGAATRNEMARLMLRDQMIVYRELLRGGIALFIHTEFGDDEAEAHRLAAESLLADAQRVGRDRAAEPVARALAEADAWILRNVVFFFTNRFDAIVDRVLPDKLVMMERRMHRVREKVLALPSEAFAMRDEAHAALADQAELAL